MPVEVFISYAHKDRKLRDELAVHLGNLRNQQVISDWYDGDLIPGTEWEQDILAHLRTAKIILLLISAHFMASSFCRDIEMQEAIARHQAKQARVIPILLRPTDWQDAPFAKLQVLPSHAKPVSRWPTHDDAFADVIKGIRRAIEDLQASASPTRPVASLASAGGSTSPGEVPPLSGTSRSAATRSLRVANPLSHRYTASCMLERQQLSHNRRPSAAWEASARRRRP